jgi:hypothetical protein
MDYGELGTLNLISDSNASKQSIDALFKVTGESLNTLSEENLATAVKLAEHDASLSSNSASIATLQTETDVLGAQVTAEAQKSALLTTQVQTLTDQIAAVTDFFTTFDLGNVITKNALGNVDLLTGTLKAAIVEAGGLRIAVADAEAATIGTAEVLPVAVDADSDGNDDFTGQPMTDDAVIARDGKTVQVLTKAMIPMVHGSRIFTTWKGNPNGFSWVEKIKDEHKDFVGFTIHLSEAITAPIKVDWLLVEQK